MNPTPAAITAIKAYVAGLAGGWAGNSDAQIVAAANAATIPNPAPQGTVPAPYGANELLGHISAASQTNLRTLSGLDSLLSDIHASDSARLLTWASFLATTGAITAQEATTMQSIVNATQPDPSWPAQISWAQANLGRPLDLDDAAKARAS